MLIYLFLTVVIFIPFASPVPGNYVIDLDIFGPYLYEIGDLSDDPLMALRSILTALFINHNAVQLVYVAALLILFGVPIEAHEGTAAAIVIFFATSIIAALVASLILHLIYPTIIDNPFLEHAWGRTWGGGSAGCFGFMGAISARARKPWVLLALFAAWETAVVTLYLREYTPAFHITALVTGFLIVRYLRIWPIRKDTP